MQTADETARETRHRNTVLLVMNDQAVRRTVAAYLRECGSVVIEARDAEQALRFKRLGDCDAALTELNVPGPMDGFSLAQAIRRHRPGTPVVLTLDTAHAGRDAVKLRDLVPGLGQVFNPVVLSRRLRRIRSTVR